MGEDYWYQWRIQTIIFEEGEQGVFGLKIRGRPGPPGPLPWIRHWILKGKEEKSKIIKIR